MRTEQHGIEAVVKLALLFLVGLFLLTGCSGGDNSSVVSSVPQLKLLAGNMGGAGNANGTGAAARFSNPDGIATDSAGNVYVADSSNYTIRKITPAGVVTTLAGTAGVMGSADGTGAAASFNAPTTVATDSTGNVYVAETNNSIIRKITPTGVVTTLAGTAGIIGSADGTGAAASFSSPYGIATDSAGNVYVTDNFDYIIRKITPAGVVTTLAGTAGLTGSADGTGAAARFSYPDGIATDSVGNVYVADRSNSSIRKITPVGVVTTVIGTTGISGFVPGNLPGIINSPNGLAIKGTTLYFSTRAGIGMVTNVP